ncbi:MAG TPA: prepilin-type N-terminal cleavage/methylation domain-containing protein [Kofleriaceae bacterium]|nr:prepilin-type N-terminal cleavage/methylation domain-containing protein [Kofleriaceae bacterium]
MRQAPSARGFTIVELMVVVAIIAILVTLAMQLSARTYGANGKNVADQANATVAIARARAISTQRYQRVQIQPSTLTIWQWSGLGMATPAGACPPNCWSFVQSQTIPSGVSVWDVSTSVYGQTTPGNNGPSAKNTTLDAVIDIRPDGSSTGGTLFISDDYATNQYRVAVYKVTGGSYARPGW